MIQEKIELLDVRFLDDIEKLKEIDRWLKVMNWPNGWHYDLDIIWVLRQIDELNLKKGSTIIDAGAGFGVTQFILASRGYNVLSLDFAERSVPKFSKNIFQIEKIDSDLGGYTHQYMEVMGYGRKKERKPLSLPRIKATIRKAADLKRFNFNLYLARHYFRQAFNPSYLFESMKDHSGFGKITFLRGTFNNIPLPDNTADILLSVSAFEHNNYEDMPGSISEFMRVIKKGSPALVTTSAAEGPDWYFEPPRAWNFSRDTLVSWFNIPQDRVSFDYGDVNRNIVKSTVLKKRISGFYRRGAESALPYGDLKQMKYLPVGIVKVKR